MKETVAPRRVYTLAPALLALAVAGCSSPLARDVVGRASEGLVFVRRNGGHDELYRARLSDGAVRQLLSAPDQDATWPYWNEAGRSLLFQTQPSAVGNAHLQIWRADRARPQALTAASTRDERWAEWSPDGTRVVYAFRGPGHEAGIAAIDVSSGREERLATSTGRDFLFRPHYAPDGSRVIAQRRDPHGRNSTLWILAPGEAPHRFTREEGWFELKPFFTRDGAWVAFTRQLGEAPRQLARANADGEVAPIEAASLSSDEHSPHPSPTRDEIAFVSGREGNRDVFLAPLVGGTARNLTNTPERDEVAPRWSPDGDLLVLTAVPRLPPGRAGDRLDPSDTHLVVVDREGHVRFETPGMMADWMPPFP